MLITYYCILNITAWLVYYILLLITAYYILLHITYYCLASYYCLACASHITFHVTHHHVIGSIKKGTYQAVICNMECT